MLCNLEELHVNLQSLIQELSEIHNKIINPIQAKKSNTHSFLIKLPKIILLIKLTPYLALEDIVSLSSTCVGMRKVIYGPIGWKLLSRLFSPYPIIIKEIASNQNYQPKSFITHQIDNFPVHMIEDEKMLKKARTQCKKSLMQVYEKFKFKEEEHTQLMRQLKSQKTHVKKLQLYRCYIQQQKNHLEQTSIDYKAQLKVTSEGFTQKIKKLDQMNEQLLKENTKLQNQKEALVGKIREYQNDIESIKIEGEKSRQILKKIKNYLLYKQL